MTYCIYHIPNKKIGVTNDLKNRVEKQQGYREGEYEVLEMSEDIDYISKRELELQEEYGYRVDRQPYKDLYKPINNENMNINVTEQTTTFPCPVDKLKGQLMDSMGMTWQTDHGTFMITKYSLDWIMDNVQTSMYNKKDVMYTIKLSLDFMTTTKQVIVLKINHAMFVLTSLI